MFVVGEESGRVGEVLRQISEYYNNDADDAIDGFVAMIEPGLTIIIGILVTWIAAAVFGPIYDMFESIGA